MVFVFYLQEIHLTPGDLSASPCPWGEVVCLAIQAQGINIWDPPDFNPGIPPGEASDFAIGLHFSPQVSVVRGLGEKACSLFYRQ